jgi:hypothetical protein
LNAADRRKAIAAGVVMSGSNSRKTFTGLIFLAALWAMAAGAAGQSFRPTGGPTPAGNVRMDSRSGQFTIYGPNTESAIKEPANSEFINLTPASLALSASRIRKIFLMELNVSDVWGDRIHIVINPRLARDTDIVVSVNRFRDGWNYRLHVPPVIAKEKLTRCIVRVLLQEMGNRTSRGQSAAVPLWLAEGMARQIQVATRTPLYPAIKEQSAVRMMSSGKPSRPGGKIQVSMHLVENQNAPTFLFDTRRHEDPLAGVKERLKQYEPLTFLQMDQAADAQLSVEEWALFRDCAHLAVARMLALRGGRDCFRRMLEVSPNYLNWQFAFLEGFKRHFSTALDMEKWWSLQIVSLTQPDLEQRLSNIDGLDRLDAILDSPVRFRGSEDGDGRPEQYPLQVMIDLMDYPEQRVALLEIILRLRRLHWQVTPDLIKLVDDYMAELDAYIVRRDKVRSSGGRGRGQVHGNAATIIRQTLDRLKFLDVIRSDTRAVEIDLAKTTGGL